MIEVLKETDQRLVMTLGTQGRRRSKIILDRESGQAWFERHFRILPSRTVQVPIADIAAVDVVDVPGLRHNRSYLVVTPKSGARRWLAGESQGVGDASARIKSFVGLPELTAPTPIHATWRWL